jgi:hypothetical protein
LDDLVLVFPQVLFEEDWELLPGQNVLSATPSLSTRLARQSLIRAVDWLPMRTEVTLVRTNLGQGIAWPRQESARDQKIEAAFQRMIAMQEEEQQQQQDQ